MSILINGMEMPRDIEPGLVIEFADGIDGKRYARLWHYRHGGLTEWLEAVSTADVRPVARGKWEWNKNNGFYYCSECGSISPREDQDGEYCDCPNFCPNCGADMREES